MSVFTTKARDPLMWDYYWTTDLFLHIEHFNANINNQIVYNLRKYFSANLFSIRYLNVLYAFRF